MDFNTGTDGVEEPPPPPPQAASTANRGASNRDENLKFFMIFQFTE
jgi:hypothetical protein